MFLLSGVCSLSLSVYRSSGVKYNRLWYAALAFVTLVLFTVAVGAVVLMGFFYTHPEACLLNKVFLGINGSLCLIISLLAISPCIQKRESLCSRAFYVICVKCVKTTTKIQALACSTRSSSKSSRQC